MKYKKLLIILGAVLFFLAAVTSYLNRVLFPQWIKKIAVERLEESLKRKVEIGSIHFNWVKGFIIDGIKIYEKDTDDVFAQADQVTFGVLFIPGFNHYRVTIPFINVNSPSVHLVHSTPDTWNFSDMYTPQAEATAPSVAGQPSKPPAFQIAWGGITVKDGKFLIDDVSSPRPWSEFLDDINLKLSLSYKGISYDFTAQIPRNNGFIGATVYYQPLTQNTQAQIHLKNINTASYLSLINTPAMRVNEGIIKDINLNINYTKDKTSAQGDMVLQNLDIESPDQSFKGDVAVHDLDALYSNGDITGRGLMILTRARTKVPGLSAGGDVQARVNDFELTKDGFNFLGSLHGQDIFALMQDRQLQVANMALDNIKVKKDADGVQSTGSITTQGLAIQWPNQKLQGDIALKDAALHLRDEKHITLETQFEADHFFTTLSGLKTPLGKSLSASAASIKADKMFLDLDDNTVKISTTLNSSGGKIILDHRKTIDASPRLELSLQVPLDHPEAMVYKGSITLSNAQLTGFEPAPFLDNVELDVDFQNDEATINALSADVLDTNVRLSGTVKDFKNPYADIIAEADELNLAKLNDFFPKAADKFGLSFDGTSSVKMQFEGLTAKPGDGKILVVASVKNVSAASSKWHQRIKNITGIVEATPRSLKWRDFTADVLGQRYRFAGTLENFKHPRISTSIDGPNLRLTATLAKNDGLITISSISGRYFNAPFESHGTVTLMADSPPVFELHHTTSSTLEDLLKLLPPEQKKNLETLHPTGALTMDTDVKGSGMDWKDYDLRATISSPEITLSGYHLTDMKINIEQGNGKVKNMTFDGKLYGGAVHAVGSLDLTLPAMPYELALNIDSTDLRQLKMDSPLKPEEIDGKFYLTTVAHGTIADFKNSFHATGSLAIRDGFLGEFNIFKGLLGILNDALRLGQVEITDVEGNFTVDNQKLNTDNLRLKGPTIVLLSRGWVNLDGYCDLNVTVDLSSGVVPAIAHDVLSTLNIHIYDKIANPKFKKRISVPEVIDSLLKNLLQ